MNRIIAIWKPRGPTSHDIINSVRKVTGVERVGHAGTLDPLAEGILVIGIGREATKQLTDAVAAEKEYIATVRLGATSTTDDEEGEKTEIAVVEKPTREKIQNEIGKFIGIIKQVPPAYSAIKVRGKTAYRRARSGETFTLKARNVEIKEIELIEYRYPLLRMRVITGPGVYIRALARDMGRALGTGAYLAALIRTRVGQFTKEIARTLQELRQK